MNNKQLAEMIKTLRKIKMEQKLVGSGGSYEGAGADRQDPASPNRKPGSITKEIHHGVVKEHQARAMYKTPRLVGDKTSIGRRGHQKAASQPKGGTKIYGRYRTGRLTEKKEVSSNTKSTIINTTPEQDSAMVGTQ